MSATENWTDTAHGTKMFFSTAANGSVVISTRMTIQDDGDVGIGTGSPADKLQVAGDIRVGTGTTGCVKDNDGSLLAGTCSSDVPFKRGITPFGPTLQSLAALQPVHYFWRAAEFPERHFGERRAYGFIAQDVEQVLPELVVTDDEGYKAVDYSKLPLLTIQAVKELKAENDALKDRVGEVDALQRRVAELERLMKELIIHARESSCGRSQ